MNQARPQTILDTNVLVYLHDAQAAAKRSAAHLVIESLEARGNTLIPAQVLAELSNVLLRKVGASAGQARLQVERLELAFPIVPLTSRMVLEALRGVEQHGMSYYDAQIWAAARLSQASMIVSEDFSHGRTVDGVRFIDPFTPEGLEMLSL